MIKDGSDAVFDWPLLNALLNIASGPPGYLCTIEAALLLVLVSMLVWSFVPTVWKTPHSGLKRVLWNDPATGVMRQGDAGYQDAKACARKNGLSLPGTLGTE